MVEDRIQIAISKIQAKVVVPVNFLYFTLSKHIFLLISENENLSLEIQMTVTSLN